MSQIRKKFIQDNAIDENKILLSNEAALRARNNADTADIDILRVNASDSVEFPTVPQSLQDAVNANDLVRLSQLQSQLEGLKPKEAVRAATTTNITLSGTQTIDGVSLVAGDRVLVKDQTTVSENGIYIVAAGAWSRSADFDALVPVDEINGAYVPVQEGTDNAGKTYVQTGNVATLGTDPINFVFFNSAATLTGGDGIIITSGTDIEVDLAPDSGLELTATDGTGQLRIKGLQDYTAVSNQILAGYNTNGDLIINGDALGNGLAGSGLTHNGVTGLIDLGGTTTQNTTVTGTFNIELQSQNIFNNNLVLNGTTGVTSLNGLILDVSTTAEISLASDLINIVAPVNGVRLDVSPDGTVPLAVATVDYVDSSIITLTDGRGTTANGSAVDLGGSFSSDITILGSDARFEVSTNDSLGGTDSRLLLEAENAFFGIDDTVSLIGVSVDLSSVELRGSTNQARLESAPNGAVPLAIATTGYADSNLGGQTLSAIAQAPTATQDGYAVVWDNTVGEYVLSEVDIAGSLAAAAGSGLTWNATTEQIDLGGALTENANIDLSGNTFDITGTGRFYVQSTQAVAAVGGGLLIESAPGFLPTGTVELFVSAGNNLSSTATRFQLTSTGFNIITNNGAIGGFQGIVYDLDYSPNYTLRSLVDKGYVDTHLGGQTLAALAQAPTATEDGFAVVWNNTTGEYTLTEIDVTGTLSTSAGDGIIWNTDRFDIDLATNSGLQLSASDGTGQLGVLLDGTTLSLSAAGLRVAVNGITESEIDTTVVDAETFLISSNYTTNPSTGDVAVGDTIEDAIKKIETKVDTSQTYASEQITITAAMVSTNQITLANTPIANSVHLQVQGAGAQLEGLDYTVATNVLTLINGLATGPEALEVGDEIVIKYAY